ncbi:alpha/beta fold hydrolase [Streptomyces pathocidini]|uniref:Alpha/beta fold hydrolase n=1 Tax=Streptomyces pathocidini TaxID=1650571 RepID=A0ABW7URC8_9ACTN
MTASPASVSPVATRDLLRHVPPNCAPLESRRGEETGEEIVELSFRGFRYDCRVLHTRTARTEPILMLGGAAQDKYSWARFEPRFTEVASVVSVDLPGWGNSDVLPARYDMAFLADAARHALDRIGVRKVNLVGACYGGTIGLRFAQRHPEHVARLLLVGARRTLSEPLRETFLRTVEALGDHRRDDFARSVVELLAPVLDQAPTRRGAALSRLLERQFLRMPEGQAERFGENAARMLRHQLCGPDPLPPAPTLFVHGEHDRYAPPAHGDEMAAHVPGARVAVMPAAGHMVQLEQPEVITDLVVRFFTDQSLDHLPLTLYSARN